MPRALDRHSAIRSGGRLHHLYTLALFVRLFIPCNQFPPNLDSAPNTSHPAFSPSEYDGHLHHDAGPPDIVPMTGLQIALAREIGGWPLYTIIIGLGQVRESFLAFMNTF